MADIRPTDKKKTPDKVKAGQPAAKKTPERQQANIQQARQNTTVYKPPNVPQQPPAPAPVPRPEPDHLELIKRILEQHDVFQQILKKMTEMVESLGTAPKAEEKYYDTPQVVIAVATPAQPNSPDTFSSAPAITGYQSENIYATVGRIATKVTVINDGTTTLFVISSPDGKTWSSENTILIGEARTFWNVYELRLRSPTAGALGPPTTGGVYRVTERDFWLAYSSAIAGSAINRAAFTAQSVQPINNLPATTQLPAIVVPNGFSLVVRATVGNATTVYLANSAANLAIAANRITLSPGDLVQLALTNADLVFVAGSGVGVNNVDILVEQ